MSKYKHKINEDHPADDFGEALLLQFAACKKKFSKTHFESETGIIKKDLIEFIKLNLPSEICKFWSVFSKVCQIVKPNIQIVRNIAMVSTR